MVVFQYCTTTVASSRCPCFAVLPFGYVRSYLKRHVTRWQLAHRHLMLLLYQISLLYKILYKRNLIMVHAIVSLHCFYSFLNNLNYWYFNIIYFAYFFIKIYWNDYYEYPLRFLPKIYAPVKSFKMYWFNSSKELGRWDGVERSLIRTATASNYNMMSLNQWRSAATPKYRNKYFSYLSLETCQNEV